MRVLKIVTTVACIAALSFGADTVGTAASSASFDLNGVTMNPQGVFSWPLVAGDELRSFGAPVSIHFQDGSRMTLSVQSSIKVVRNGDTLSVNVVSGLAQFSLTPDSGLQVLSAGQRIGTRSGLISPVGGTSSSGGTTWTGPREMRRPPPPAVSSP